MGVNVNNNEIKKMVLIQNMKVTFQKTKQVKMIELVW